MEINQEAVWSKIFGIQIRSHTYTDVDYTISMTAKGWKCTCMDFKIRKGSYEIVFDSEHFNACKHVIDHLRDLAENHGKHTLKYRKIGSYSWQSPRC